MSNINKLLNALKENEYIKSFKPTDEDFADFLLGSTRGTSRLVGGDNLDAINGSVVTGLSPTIRILSKPFRIAADGLSLLGDPKWSLKNNKIGLTKDALLINVISDLLENEEESNINEELDNYEQY